MKEETGKERGGDSDKRGHRYKKEETAIRQRRHTRKRR